VATLSEAVRRGGVTHSALVQIAFVLGLGFLVYEAAALALAHMHAHHIPTDFGFWNERAGFDIDPHLIAYSFTSTYGRAFFVGLINTLVVSAVGIVFASLLGFAIGAARLSSNLVVAKFAGFYVEALRNVPLLLQILFWYNGVLKALPAPRASLAFPGHIFLNDRGLFMPAPTLSPPGLSLPVFHGFNFSGGMKLSPEFVALTLSLVLYTATFIAEIVRAGIAGVPKGQGEAAAALGLNAAQARKFVIVPQALRLIVPPLTSQYLNLFKNSSLAVFIGYPDLVQVFAGTVLNQTGAAVPVIAVTMAVYLCVSLLGSLAMNLFNRRIAGAVH
jgi:general L-amino acid transport system permease protein